MEPHVRRPRSVPVPDFDGKVDLAGLSYEELADFVQGLGEKAFRAKQLYHWIHQKQARSFDAMLNLSKAFRAKLEEASIVAPLCLEETLVSVDGTRKMLLRTRDGHQLETVLIPADERLTQCISSQVGCRIGCKFCLTATMPLRRDLTVGEILDQVYHARRLLEEGGERLTNLVYMGMGEPLDNLQAVTKSCDLLADARGLGMSPRRITISTSGLIPGIGALGEGVPVNLAISLNASNDTVRDQVIPINRKYPIETLMEAVRSWPRDRRQKVTMEYVLLADVNDGANHAKELVRLLLGLDVRVNLIPFNPYPGALFGRPDEQSVAAFGKTLRDHGFRVTVRKSRGEDIGAACGMLDGKPASQP